MSGDGDLFKGKGCQYTVSLPGEHEETLERFSNTVNVDVNVFRAHQRSPCPILH